MIEVTEILAVIHWLCTLSVAVGLVRVLWIVSKVAEHADRSVVADLKRRMDALDLDLDDMFDRVKRLTARKGMQKRREEQEHDADDPKQQPGESDIDWKRRARRLLAEGKLKHET